MSRFIKPLATAVVVLLVLGGAALAFSRDDNDTYTVTAYSKSDNTFVVAKAADGTSTRSW